VSQVTLVRRIAARPSIVFDALTTSEGMSPKPTRPGANGRVYAARIQWAKANTAWNQH